ncbi:MAG: hypothetical protein ACRCTP_02295 [Aeromonas popoffii]|uniref:hypothetical protein n=1 Tax=Aeromonas popoffii TaxID=70856 RepID=UPI003F2C965C
MNKLKTIIIMVVLLAIALVFYRGLDWSKCGIASYDLKRNTEFSWVTGSCMIERANGERIYLKQLRGMEGGE